MNITTTKGALLSALAVVAPAAERTSVVQIFTHVLLSSRGGKVAITANNSKVQATVTTDIDCDDGLFVAVEPAKMIRFLSTLHEQAPVSIAIDKNKATVKSGRSWMSVPHLPGEDFPQAMATFSENDATITLPQSALKAAIDAVEHAQADQDVRYYLVGVHFVAAPGGLALEASDGHRLAVVSVEADVSKPAKFIVARQTVAYLSRLLGSDDPVSITVGETTSRVVLGDLEVIARNVDGVFPDVSRFEFNRDNAIAVNRIDLVEAIQRAKVVANKKTRAVKIGTDPETQALQVFVDGAAEACGNLVEITGAGTGDMAINIDYLLESVSAIKDDTANLNITQGDSGGRLTVWGSGNAKQLIMGMRA